MTNISNNIILHNSAFSRIGYSDNESSLPQSVVLTCASALATHMLSGIQTAAILVDDFIYQAFLQVAA